MPPVCRAWRKLNRAVRAVPMWSGPVGLGAIRTRSVVIRRFQAGPAGAPGTRWKSAGSASPGRTWTSDAGRRPSVARPRGPSSVSESSDSERARTVTWAPGVRARASRYESRPGVLLGLLGDPVDRRPLAGLDLAQRRALRPAAGRLGVDRVAVGTGRRMAQHLVEAGLDPRRDRALEPGRLLVGLRPAEPHDRAEQPLDERVAPEDRVGGRPARAGQDELPAVGLVDEAVRAEPPEHLAGGLGRDAHPTGDLGSLDVGAVAGHHPQRQQVLLRGRRQARGVVAAVHHGDGTRRQPRFRATASSDADDVADEEEDRQDRRCSPPAASIRRPRSGSPPPAPTPPASRGGPRPRCRRPTARRRAGRRRRGAGSSSRRPRDRRRSR